jgi:hypothetical protein
MPIWDRKAFRLGLRVGSDGSEGLFVPSGHYGKHAPTRLLILEQGRNPTTDYYLRPRLPVPEQLPTTVADLSADPKSVPIPAGTFVVIVRYLNRPWARYLLAHRNRLSGTAYLMDDDLPAALQARDLPLRYRWKIQRLFLSQRGALSTICDRIWVANSYLAEKYPQSGATVLPALPLAEGWGETTPLTYFYYGSASHGREQSWLVDVVRSVQAEAQKLTFVTIGGGGVRKLFAGIPRVLVLHPMPWPSYVEALPAIRHAIGLAPLLEGPFNRSRSYTKFLDFSRLGAAGIYSNTAPYAGFVRDGVDGFLLENQPDAWRRVIIELARAPGLRRTIVENARSRAFECHLPLDIHSSTVATGTAPQKAAAGAQEHSRYPVSTA